jgi:hypothetical protein
MWGFFAGGAQHARTQDQADFDRVVPRLDRAARTWLRDSVARIDPDHPWLSVCSTKHRRLDLQCLSRPTVVMQNTFEISPSAAEDG